MSVQRCSHGHSYNELAMLTDVLIAFVEGEVKEMVTVTVPKTISFDSPSTNITTDSFAIRYNNVFVFNETA